MANSPQLFVQRTIGAASEMIYTVPAATSVILNYISFCNATSSGRSVSVGLGDNGATKIWRTDMALAASETREWSGALTLEPADIIAMDADEASAIQVLIAGLKIT